MLPKYISRSGLLISVASMGLPVATYAQDVAETRETGLSEIVVTAQKRKENLQDTPLAISAVTAETIASRGISDVGALNAIAPNLVVNQTPVSSSSPSITIRGIGQSEPILTADAPNAIYIDGVVVGRSTGAMFELVDLERIEVLRGPQGTLFGRNTTGGALSLITARPADEFGVQQTVGYGHYSLFKVRSTLDTGELGSSGIRAKFSYIHKERNGYVDNILESSSNDPGSYNLDAVRAAVTFDNGGPINAFYAFDYNIRHSRSIPSQLVAVAPYVAGYLNVSPQLGGATPQISRGRLDRLALDHDGPLTDKVIGHNFTFEAELSDSVQLRSISAYREWSSIVGDSDLDGNANLVGFTVSPAILAPPNSFIPLGINPINLYSGTNDRKQYQWSQEFNLIGNIGYSFEYVLGAFYFYENAREADHSKLTIVVPLDNPIPLGPGISTPAFGVNIDTFLTYRHKSESKALFGQATYNLTDQLSITGGLRYTWDKKTLDQTQAVVKRDSVNYGQLTWMATAKYDFTDDISSYLRVSTGYKSGGFNPRGAGGAFKPEKVTAYEVGLKSELFDRRVRLNLAAFHTVYRDLQISQFEAGTTGANSVTVNAGKATYTGIEAELLAQIADSLTLSANMGYVKRKYQEYLFRDPVTDVVSNLASVARFPYSASTTGNVGIEYEFPSLGFGALSARADYNYRSGIYYNPLDNLSPFNQLIADGSASTFDARLTLSEIDLGTAEFTFALWGKNLTNTNYQVSGIDFGQLGFATVSYAEPRTWGVDATIRF